MMLAATLAITVTDPVSAQSTLASGSLRPVWSYTTTRHFSAYGFLAAQPISPEGIRGTALRQNSVVLAQIAPGEAGLTVVGLSRQDGRQLWRRALSGDFLPMSRELPVVDRHVLVPLYDSVSRDVTIIGLDLGSGTILWRRGAQMELNRYQYGNLVEVDHGGKALDFYLPGTVKNNRISVSIDGSWLRSASYETYFWPAGARRYRNLVLGFQGEPLTTTVRALVAVDERTGLIRWRIPTGGRWTSPPVLTENLLLFTTGQELIALDPATGEQRWSAHLQGEPPPDPAPPMLADRYVLLTQRLKGTLPLHSSWVFTRHAVNTGVENGVVQIGERIGSAKLVQRLGPLVAAEGDVRVDIVDPAIPALRVTTSFESTFSRFVLATPRVWMGSADDRGFLIVTSDGKLRYYDLPLSLPAVGR